MTSNQHGPYARGYTRVTMAGTAGSDLVTGSESRKPVLVRIGVIRSRALYTPPVKPWEPGVPEVRNREGRPRAKLVTGAKS